jgi:chemotaxis protein MotB
MTSDESREVDVHPKPKGSVLPWFLVVLLLAACGGGFYWFDQQLSAQRADAARLRTMAEEAQRNADSLRAANAQLSGQITQLQHDNEALSTTKDELSKDIAAKDDQLSQLKGTYDALQDKMKAEIAKGDIRLSESGGKLRVDLVDKILFDVGEAQVSKRGEEVLQRVGAVLASIQDKQIQVSGHTDDSPIMPRLQAQFPTNWELSAARATNVVRFLSEKAGVSGKRLVASGYGQFHPISSNATPVGRARNRRIEILLAPLTEPVPNKVVVAKATAPARAVSAKSKTPAKTVKSAPVKKVVPAKHVTKKK